MPLLTTPADSWPRTFPCRERQVFLQGTKLVQYHRSIDDEVAYPSMHQIVNLDKDEAPACWDQNMRTSEPQMPVFLISMSASLSATVAHKYPCVGKAIDLLSGMGRSS